MKVLMIGDSFGVPKKEDPFPSWISMLSQTYDITNLSECGISEYRIFKKLSSAHLNRFDSFIIIHTSPFRTYVDYNPIHSESEYHKNCDVILADIENRNDDFSKACQQYFKHIWNKDYSLDIHNLLCMDIQRQLKDRPTLHITNFDYRDCYDFNKELLCLWPIWQQHKGNVAHYDQEGNRIVFDIIDQKIKNIL